MLNKKGVSGVIALQSSLEHQEMSYPDADNALRGLGFTLGGNWDYTSGCFDCALNEEQTSWLRLPFRVVSGTLDAEQKARDTFIRFGTPYGLRHLPTKENDPEARLRITGALVDQFQDPADPDAPVDPLTEHLARERLRAAEEALLQ
jgi:YugN-like family.